MLEVKFTTELFLIFLKVGCHFLFESPRCFKEMSAIFQEKSFKITDSNYLNAANHRLSAIIV